jgi:hypothetical protein
MNVVLLRRLMKGWKASLMAASAQRRLSPNVDTDPNQIMGLDNRNMHHEHGACSPIVALNGNRIDAMGIKA